MTPPTPTEVEKLARELSLNDWNLVRHSQATEAARWILTRFVRREEHERLRANHDSLCNSHNDLEDELARLRAELRGQRCDGSGRLLVLNKEDGITYTYWCPLSGCPACKPTDDGGRPTPKHDDWEPCKLCGCPEGRCPGAELSCHGNPCFHIRDGGRTREGASGAESDLPKGGASLDSAAPVITLKCRRCGRLAATEMYCAHCYVITKYAEGEEPPWLDDVLRAVEGMECLVMQAPAPAPVVHVVQLHEDTVRALVAALQFSDLRPFDLAMERTDKLLAKLKEPKS